MRGAQGLGRELLRRFIDDACRLGAEQIFLEVRVSNAPAIALYEAEGFTPVGRRDSLLSRASPKARSARTRSSCGARSSMPAGVTR